MGKFGKKKKRNKGAKQKLSENRRRFIEIEDYEDEEEYEEEYYGEDEPESYGDDGYYEEDGGEEGYYGDDGYYEGDSGEYEEDQGYYEEEYYGDDVDYYEDNTRYDDGEEEEDDDEVDDDDDLYYMDDGEYEDDDEDDDDDFVAYRKKRGVAAAFLAFGNLPFIDKVITLTGVAVLVFAVVTGTVFLAAKKEDRAVEAFAGVGTSLAGIAIIGERGLLAVADAQLAKAEAPEEAAEETEAAANTPTAAQPDEGVDVTFKTTSIVKDLKIKFVNKETDKLIANVPFEVEVKAPGGKATVWKDDDEDGIIYQEDIASGAYQVKMLPLTGFDKYRFSTESRSADVKADITYKKVDVKEEIKTEAEVNAAVEDTAVPEVVEESKLTDTVAFVASSGTKGQASYREIDRSMIADPATMAAAARSLGYLAELNATLSGSVQTFGNGNLTLSGSLTSGNGNLNASSNNPDSDNGGSTVSNGNQADSGGGNSAVSSDNPPKQEEPVLLIAGVSVEVGKVAEIKITKKENVEKITWFSGNTSKATVDELGKVTGVAEGEVTVTATGTNKSGDKSSVAACTVKVTAAVPSVTQGNPTVSEAPTVSEQKPGSDRDKKDYASDTTSLLKDKNGRQVYVQQGDGQYRQAKYADYYDAGITKFYIEESDTLYTGWQHIDGKTYYYMEDNKPATGEQIIQGAKYSFASDGSLITSSGTFGIDVSKWNGSIDWNSVKSSGAAYAIIRCGYRGSKSGAMITDPKFAENMTGAAAAGLKVGVYFFSQAVNEKEAVEEASMALDLIKKYAISYPVFLDVESSGGRADKIDKATRTAVCKAFCATVQDSGYTAGIYANKTWLNEKMDVGALNGYKIWLAQYAATPSYNGKYDMWQYSAKGSVPGISGKVDLNLSYLGY